MIVYHGTVDAYLPSIQKSGLKVVSENRMHATLLHMGFIPKPLPLEKGIYVTTLKSQAEHFAKFRALWLSTPGGEGFDSSMNPAPMIRDDKAPPIHSNPIVLKIDLSPTLAEQLRVDDRSDPSMHAYWSPATIPPEFIRQVIPVSKPLYYDSPEVN